MGRINSIRYFPIKEVTRLLNENGFFVKGLQGAFRVYRREDPRPLYVSVLVHDDQVSEPDYRAIQSFLRDAAYEPNSRPRASKYRANGVAKRKITSARI